MEQKKRKPFDLEAAKAGAPVISRLGYPVKIYDYEFKQGAYKLSGKIINPDEDALHTWTEEGYYDDVYFESEYDLFMSPVKKEGWVNLYKRCWGIAASSVHEKESEALKVQNNREDYITTVKIEWKE